MADFDFSSWRQQATVDPRPPPPPPTIDPAQARENAIADNTRAEEATNDFLGLKQQALFRGPDPYFAKQGKDAFLAAPAAVEGLRQSGNRLVDGMANDAQRRRLGPMLDAQIGLAGDDIARHAAQQYLQWQRDTAQNRIDGLTREAALLHPDTAIIGSLADAAAAAARAKGQVGGAAPDSDSEEAAVTAARSGVYNAALQARLDAGNTAGAAELYDNVQHQLTPEHAGSLGPQIATAQNYAAAKNYADGIVPDEIAGSIEIADAQQAAATERNQADNAGEPEFRTLAQHHINQAFNAQRRALQQTAADTAGAVNNWVNTPQSDGAPQTNLPPPALWNRLTPEQRGDLVDRLDRNSKAITKAQNATLASSITIPESGLPAASDIAKGAADAAAAAIARAAPFAARLATAGGAAASILLTPTNSQSSTIDLDDELRVRTAPGQRTITIERRVDDGLFGTGIGARWETLPVQAEWTEVGPDRRVAIAIDPRQLEDAIGSEAADRVLARTGVAPLPESPLPPPPFVPWLIESRIATSVDGGKTIVLSHVSRDWIEKVCRSFAEFEGIALKASAKAKIAGLLKGPARGRSIHKGAELEIKKLASVQGELEKRGIRELQPEVAIRNGIGKSYVKGYSKLDVLEIHDDLKTVCVYEFKTGGARFPSATMRRYVREAGKYAQNLDLGYTHVYAVPIWIP